MWGRSFANHTVGWMLRETTRGEERKQGVHEGRWEMTVGKGQVEQTRGGRDSLCENKQGIINIQGE